MSARLLPRLMPPSGASAVGSRRGRTFIWGATSGPVPGVAAVRRGVVLVAGGLPITEKDSRPRRRAPASPTENGLGRDVDPQDRRARHGRERAVGLALEHLARAVRRRPEAHVAVLLRAVEADPDRAA